MRISRSTSSSSSSSNQSSISAFCSAALRRKYLNVGPIDSRLVNDEEGLVRGLSLTDLILIGIGASIGAGIFVVTGTAARDAGPGVAISFILAGAACILNALCYAELSSRFPATVGGAYMYSYTAFNELTAFLVFAQLMVDYHIGAASIARSLASYLISFLELFPFLKGHFPSWISGGTQFFNGIVSINILAPILLILLTVILCYGVKESSAVNSFMTATKVLIVIFVILAGSFKVDVSNWSPFVPNGFKAVVTGATVVFFAYVGFDAVANSAEEAKKPQRDLPIGILGSLIVCIILYVAVCLVLTGMIPYSSLGEEAPLAEAFTSKGMKYVSVLISIAAVAGLTTTLLVGLYVQSRLYLGLGRDGLLPSIFAKVHPTRHTPVHSQIWVGCVAAIMGGLFNVHMLSHILSVGTLTGYSVVCACLITLRWRDKQESQVTGRCISTRLEGVICLLAVACCGFSAGLCYRYNASFVLVIVFVFLACLAGAALHFRQVYIDPPGFSCPGVPTVPVVSIFFNIFLFAQAKRNGAQEKKNVAFQAEKDDSDSDNEDMAMIAKNFKKFLKFNKNKFKGNKNNFNNNSNSSKPSSSAMECYECHKKGHMKKDCPERKKNNFKKDKTKRKAFSVTWDDTDSSSSSESESDNEQANVCFMASSDDVPHKKRGKWILDSGCSKHMTGNKEMLSNIIYSNGGAVTFGDNSKGYIIGKGDLHEEAWYRFVILSIISVVIYAVYGQFHAKAGINQSNVYHGVSTESDKLN